MVENENFLDRLQAGDEKAFQLLVEKYHPMIKAIGIQMFERTEDQDDYAQEVFIKIYYALKSFRRQSSITTWIYRIALNHALNLSRKNKWKLWLNERLSVQRSNGSKGEVLKHEVGQMDENTEQKELRRILNKAIQRLPENQRIAFVMTRIEGMSYVEVARVMNISESAVDSLTQRARQNLRKYLSNYYHSF